MASERRQKKFPNLKRGGGSEKQTAAKPVGGRQRSNANLKRGGSPGRPKGVPNKATKEAKAFAELVLHDPLVQQRIIEDARKGRLPPPVMTTLMGHAWGKPKERVELTLPEKLHVLITDDIGDDGPTSEPAGDAEGVPV